MATMMAEYAIFFAISSVQITLSLLLVSVIMSSDRICSRSGAILTFTSVRMVAIFTLVMRTASFAQISHNEIRETNLTGKYKKYCGDPSFHSHGRPLENRTPHVPFVHSNPRQVCCVCEFCTVGTNGQFCKLETRRNKKNRDAELYEKVRNVGRL